MLRSEETIATMTDGALPIVAAAARPAATFPDHEVALDDRPAAALAVKAVFDRVFAFVLLALMSPVFVAIALAVWLGSAGPVFYRQRRTGLHGCDFTILKFRTMVDTGRDQGEADAAWAAAEMGLPEPELTPDRCTTLGRWLRRFGLDELPQLVNVLKGDMALVGPRPERTTFVARFERHIPGYDGRHRMRPGLTGWAQVHGLRGQTSLHDRTRRDHEYIDQWNLLLHLRILV